MLLERDSRINVDISILYLNGFCYIIGSILFLIGSVLYYPQINNPTLGAYIYTFGGAVFLLVAMLDLIIGYQSNKFLNPILYFIGSWLYLIGCICYIPETKLDRIGGYLFCIGGVFYLFGCIREMKSNPRYNAEFAISITTAIGVVLFSYGAILFLDIDNDTEVVYAVHIFVAGSILFIVSAYFICLVHNGNIYKINKSREQKFEMEVLNYQE